MEKKAQAEEALLSSTSGQEALNHAIRAAELYIQAAAGDSVGKAEAARFRRKCQDLISRAEQLKALITRPAVNSQPPPSATAANVLRMASHLHGNEFPAWSGEPLNDEFMPEIDGELFVDNAIFPLSSAQMVNLASWSRPYEIFNLATRDDGHLMAVKGNCDLVQDVTTDCSVVAGLSAAVRILLGKHSVLSTIIYPFDHAKGQPKVSLTGKYVLRMNFNGCARRVVIDDRLPASRTDRGLFVVDRCNPLLIWPALLEKAYLKVRGGYDFPGSNSGTDLWVLTGWIPEQIFLQREDFNLDETWARIKAAYDLQDVIVTLGTGRVSPEEEDVMGLVGEHDYAVQAIDSSRSVRRFLVKNPWSQGQPRMVESQKTLQHFSETTSDTRSPLQNESDSDATTPGTLWFTIESVAQHFESMYINWNPALFSHRLDHHFAWKMPTRDLSLSVVDNPQFSLFSTTGGVTWILLNRHFQDAELQIARNKSESMTTVSRQLGFMSILVFEADGQRIQISDGATYRGPYVDSPQTLARLRVEARRRYTIVVDQQELPLQDYSFTLSVFAHQSFVIKEAEERMTHHKELRAAWNRRSAGGNPSCSTYYVNPQYRLTVSKRSPVSILLATDNQDVHVHVDLVWSRGERAKTVRVKDLVASSGEYRRGCAVANTPHLEEGVYTLVCSTFEAGQMAAFTLRVNSMVAVSLEPVPADEAGKLRTNLPPITFRGGVERWEIPLTVSWLTRASASICRAASSPESTQLDRIPQSNSMARMSVIYGQDYEQTNIVLLDDGIYQDLTGVIWSSQFDLEPKPGQTETAWLVIESKGAVHARHKVRIDIFSDGPIHVGAWKWKNLSEAEYSTE